LCDAQTVISWSIASIALRCVNFRKAGFHGRLRGFDPPVRNAAAQLAHGRADICTMRTIPSVANPSADPLAAARAALNAGQAQEAALLAGAVWRAVSPNDEQARADAGFVLCTCHYRLGNWSAMLENSEPVLPLLQRCGRVAERVELLRWVTLAACELGRFEQALRCANESCALAEAHGDATQLALSLVALGICIERMGDPWQAHRLMEEALARMEGMDNPYARCMILNNLCASYIGAFYLLRDGEAVDQAREVIAKAVRHAREARTIAPGVPGAAFFVAIIDGNLAETLLHLGELDEAEALVTAALAQVTGQGNLARAWRVRYVRGMLLLGRGRADEAAAELTAVWHELEGSQQHNTLARVHDALYRCWRRLGDPARALVHLESFEGIERKRVVSQLQAQSTMFVTRVEAERARVEAHAERERAAEMEQRSLRDPLTGLGNRRLMEQRLPALLTDAERAGQPVSVALVDLDHFKHVNDRFGHPVGDAVLVRIAELLRSCTRGGDLLLRLGGEEFLIVLAGATLDTAREVTERLRTSVQRLAWDELAPGLAVTLSVGLASTPPFGADALNRAADDALYRAKRAGRNRVES
jgi:diguanylate cyclase (GGDEF)-like protein